MNYLTAEKLESVQPNRFIINKNALIDNINSKNFKIDKESLLKKLKKSSENFVVKIFKIKNNVYYFNVEGILIINES